MIDPDWQKTEGEGRGGGGEVMRGVNGKEKRKGGAI